MFEIHKQALAEQDLIDIWLYLFEKWGPVQADAYLDQLNVGLVRLADHPKLGADYSHIQPGYRRLAVEHHRVYYRIESNRIAIIRVLHESMEPERHLNPT